MNDKKGWRSGDCILSNEKLIIIKKLDLAKISITCPVYYLIVLLSISHRTVLYECCPGYMKMDGMRGCPAGTNLFSYGWVSIWEALQHQRLSKVVILRNDCPFLGVTAWEYTASFAYSQHS